MKVATTVCTKKSKWSKSMARYSVCRWKWQCWWIKRDAEKVQISARHDAVVERDTVRYVPLRPCSPTVFVGLMKVHQCITLQYCRSAENRESITTARQRASDCRTQAKLLVVLLLMLVADLSSGRPGRNNYGLQWSWLWSRPNEDEWGKIVLSVLMVLIGWRWPPTQLKSLAAIHQHLILS